MKPPETENVCVLPAPANLGVLNNSSVAISRKSAHRKSVSLEAHVNSTSCLADQSAIRHSRHSFALMLVVSLVPLGACQGQAELPMNQPGGGQPGTISGGSGGDQAGVGSGGDSGSVPVGTGGSVRVNGTGGNGAGTGTGGQAPVSGTGGRAATVDAGAGAGGGTLLSLPCDVQTLLVTRCQTCHGPVPAPGTPASLVTYQNLTAPSKLDPTKTEAVMAVSRMQNPTLPMPPLPGSHATASEVATMQSWIAAGYPSGSCTGGSPADGGASDGGVVNPDGPTPVDPFAVPPACTSKITWTGGNNGSASMNPGMACINCHNTGDAPRYTIAGTIYPTAHEPDRCNGANGTNGAQVVILGADGKTLTLTPNSVGSFYSNAPVAMPYRAKVTFMGRERLMITPQMTGDCNSCHTQNGALMAPGRILLP